MKFLTNKVSHSHVSNRKASSKHLAGIALSLLALTFAANSSAHAELITANITTTWYEPDTQPCNSVFVGSFTYDTTTFAVTNLQGKLSESMTGSIAYNPATGPNGTDDMTWLTLSNQLPNGDASHTYTWHDAILGGTFATVFLNTSSLTFWTGDGGDGWSPQAGVDAGGIYAGFPKIANNPQNAYAMVFIPDNFYLTGSSTLTWDEATGTGSKGLSRTAYADFMPGGMMGAAGMTATSEQAYGSVGTMEGYPASQTITVVPEPSTLGRVALGSGRGLWLMRRRNRHS